MEAAFIAFVVLVVGIVGLVRPTWTLFVPTRRLVALTLAVFVSACGTTPTGPSATEVPTPPAPPPSQVLSQWSVTMNDVTFNRSTDSCTEEAVRSVLGVPKPYSIRVTQTGSEVDVMLTSSSGDYDCTFTRATSDSNGFTTRGTSGFYTCRTDYATNNFSCSNGTPANLFTFGQDLSGTISGDDISGTWEIFWEDRLRGAVGVPTRSEFTGRRQ